MASMRRLLPFLAAVAVALAGIAMGAQAQRENALPFDVASQNQSNQRAAAGDPILLTGIVVAGGIACALWTLAPMALSGRRLWLPLGAAFAGLYVLVNLAQTAWPFYAGIPDEALRQAVLRVNLLASNGGAAPSVLIPIMALWAGGALLAFWGARRLLQPLPPADPRKAPLPSPTGLLRRQTGTLLVAAPFLGLGSWGCMRIMAALPPVPGATPYRIVLSLAALALLGLLMAGAAKSWQLARAAREPRMAPLSLEAWEGIGRAEVGLAALLGLLAMAVVFMPGFPPASPDCAPIVPNSRVACDPTDPAVQYHDELVRVEDLLRAGHAFATKLHVHVGFLPLALVPLVPMVAIHRDGVRLLDSGRSERQALPRGWTPVAATALGLSFALGGAATWWFDGALVAWVAASVPLALAGRALAAPARHAQALLLAAWATWALGNSLEATYNEALASGVLRYGAAADPNALALWRLLGAVLAGWAFAILVRAPAREMRSSKAIPLATGTAVSAIAVMLLELPLDIWTNTWTGGGTVHGSSIYVGTSIARLEPVTAVVVHVLCLALTMGAAAMAARLLRPDWFGGRGGPPLPTTRPAAQPMA